MYENFDIEALRGTTYATIRAAFNTSPEITKERGNAGHANITSITTRLIQNVGRFSENWSSDALYGIDKLRAAAESDYVLGDKDLDEIVTFGIRRDGVDHGAYVMQNLLETRSLPAGYVFPGHKYRRIMAVRIRVWRDSDLHCVRVEMSLRDITNSVYKLQPADLDETGFKIIQLPGADRENPQPEELYRIDHEDIANAVENGPFRFEARQVSPDDLRKDGCTEDADNCVEIVRVNTNPLAQNGPGKPHPVCRAYRVKGARIVVWLDVWYKNYSEVRALIPD